MLVVGAGPAGLATALGLADRGADVAVLERGDEVGGRVRTIGVDGHRVELGPAGILDDAPDTQRLLARLGAAAPATLAADPRVRRRYVVRDGRPRALPTGPLSLLFGTTLTWRERIALLREPRVPRGDDAAETVAGFARRRFGASIAEAFAQPIVVGIFGGDYEALELRAAFPKVAALEAAHGSVVRGLRAEAAARRKAGRPRAGLVTFDGGMGALPRALAGRLGDRVRLGCGVVAIERHGPGVRARLDDGTVVAADRAVLAVPPEAAAELVAPLDAPLGGLLAATPSVPIASVSLGWADGELAHPLDGFGLLVPRGAGYKTLGVLFMSSIFPTVRAAPPGRVLLRALVGGANDPRIGDLDDEAVLALAEAEVAALLGARAPASFRHVQRWPDAIPQYTVGHLARAEQIDARARALGLELVGTALRGVGVNDVLRDAAGAVERLAGGG